MGALTGKTMSQLLTYGGVAFFSENLVENAQACYSYCQMN